MKLWSVAKAKCRMISVGLCIVLIGSSWLWWEIQKPWIYIHKILNMDVGMDIDHTKQHQVYAQRLSDLGPRAIVPIVETIRTEGPWGPRTIHLVSTLKKLGSPAEQQLILAIDSESIPIRRIFLVYALQGAFNNYSRINLWLEHITAYPLTSGYLQSQLRNRFGLSVPEVIKGGTWNELNTAFVGWYERNTVPKGPFPLWKQRNSISTTHSGK